MNTCSCENSNNEEEYYYLTESDLKKFFNIQGNQLLLGHKKCKSITIQFPFKLGEDMAKISAMIMDGSISKNFCQVLFCQKKDVNKVDEFSMLIEKSFGLKSKRVIFHNDAPGLFVSSKALGIFLNKCVGIHKSDESARIPFWIWNSPKSVVIEYLKYAFAMEGSVLNYTKATEIRFHTVDMLYVEDLKKILKLKFNIDSKIQKYYISGYGWKYYLYISHQDSVVKFQEIGFALASHQLRLNELINSFKNKAWEVTLLVIGKLDNTNSFTLKDVCREFPYLCIRAVHSRLTSLVSLGYLQKKEDGYSLTDTGLNIALKLEKRGKITKLRTNPKENEENILKFLSEHSTGYRNEIARELKVNSTTIRDTLQRLVNKQKIQMVSTDKFQRKYYTLKDRK